jgi:Flp pilus assembly protein TadG
MKSERSSIARGSASVEFALVLPLVLVVGLALLQVALLAKDQLILQESARAGARQAAVSKDDGSVRAAAIAAAGTLDPSRIQIAIDRAPASDGPVTVTVTYDAPIEVPVVRWLFPSHVRLSARATMRQEEAGP